VDLNCAGLTRDLLETELFGQERGPSPERFRPRPGFSRSLTKAPSFLDEIGDVDVQVQPKLLKVLEKSSFAAWGTCAIAGRYSA